MENFIDPAGKVTENAVNMSAAVAMHTTPPAPTNDDTTTVALLGGWCKRNNAHKPICRSLSRSKKLKRVTFKATIQRKLTRSWPPTLPLHDYKAFLRPLGGLRLDK
ncbi:hypothetical protein MRX96_051680 [Rhipicephalus microplus]